MHCPACDSTNTYVADTIKDTSGSIRRRRECKACGRRFSTIERIIDNTPLVVKRGGRREPFNRDKILSGLRVSCAKRPVSAEDIERLGELIESQVMALNKGEISARWIGDRVLAGLRELDEVAYIRYAIVYLNLKDLESVKGEIEKLLGER